MRNNADQHSNNTDLNQGTGSSRVPKTRWPTWVLALSLGCGAASGVLADAQAVRTFPTYVATDRQLLEVRIRNYAGVPLPELRGAMDTARYVMQRAGVESRWLNCSSPQDSNEFQRSCDQPTNLGVVILNIVSDNRDPQATLSKDAVGLALVPDGHEIGTTAYVFYTRVKRLVEAGSGLSRPTILGCIIAHEVGHLLLGSNAHSRGGLMAAHWYGPALRRAEMGTLLFDSDQSSRIRRALVVRTLRATVAHVRCGPDRR